MLPEAEAGRESMTRFLFGNLLWRTIEREAKSAHRTKAAIAYVTRNLPLRFKAGDVLIVDSTFLKRIRRIPVTTHLSGAKSIVRSLPKGYRRRLTWLIGVHDIEEPTDPAELRRIEKGTDKAERRVSDERSDTAWISMPRRGSWTSKAKDGDSVVLIDRGSESSNPERVIRHTAILLVQKEPNCT